MLKLFLLFLLLPLLLPKFVFASDLESLAKSEEWLRLLYYKHHWFRGHQSALDGNDFFLSKNPEDPYLELQATLQAFEEGRQNIGKKKQPAICAFPLRRQFLENALKKKFPSFPCTEKDSYFEKIRAKRAYLVFATAYTGNPASMFGHSFLKLESKENSSLLDWSINYAAMVPEDENPFAFAYFGLTGGYSGQFTLVPYYMKVEEYGLSEGRDLWEYELNFDSKEIERLLNAIWEIETNSHYDYFFFDENCSLQLLTLLEVVRPDWNLSGYFLHMIPGESVKKVALLPGAVRQVRMRPSLERRLRLSVARLNSEEKEFFEKGKAGNFETTTPNSLEALGFYFQAEKKREGEKWTREASYRELLQKISKSPAPSNLEIDGKNTRPDLSHGAYAIAIAPTWQSHRDRPLGLELGIRFAYHQLMDSDAGYLPHSEVLFPHFLFEWRDSSLQLKQFEGFSLVSLQPWSLIHKPISWRTKGGYRRFLEGDQGIYLEALLGSSFRKNGSTLWTLLGGEARWKKNVIGIPWLESGWIHTFSNEAKFLLGARMGYRSQWLWQLNGSASYPLAQNVSLRLESQYQKWELWVSEWKILALHYF